MGEEMEEEMGEKREERREDTTFSQPMKKTNLRTRMMGKKSCVSEGST